MLLVLFPDVSVGVVTCDQANAGQQDIFVMYLATVAVNQKIISSVAVF